MTRKNGACRDGALRSSFIRVIREIRGPTPLLFILTTDFTDTTDEKSNELALVCLQVGEPVQNPASIAAFLGRLRSLVEPRSNYR